MKCQVPVSFSANDVGQKIYVKNHGYLWVMQKNISAVKKNKEQSEHKVAVRFTLKQS